jgi:hypothetical protein
MVSLTTIIEHLGSSVDPLEKLISGFCYVLGIVFIWESLKRLKVIADKRSQSGGGQKVFSPLAFFLGGAALFFLPTTYTIMTNTLWGSGSPIAYTSWVKQLVEKYGESNAAVTHILQLAGLIWFVRGTVLLVHATEPGNQHGTKGLLFLIAGVMSMNIQYTFTLISSGVNFMLTHFFK